MTKKQDKRMTRMMRLENACPERFCWADLVSIAFYGGELRYAIGEQCRDESKKSGACWCGKFVGGKRREKNRQEDITDAN